MSRLLIGLVKFTGWPVQWLCFRTKVTYENRAVQSRRIKGPAIIVSNHTAVYDYAVLLFVFLRNWKQRPGFTTGCYLLGYACIRFGIEFLRDDMRQRFGEVSIGQVISIGLFVLGISFILVSVLRSRAENCKISGPTN